MRLCFGASLFKFENLLLGKVHKILLFNSYSFTPLNKHAFFLGGTAKKKQQLQSSNTVTWIDFEGRWHFLIDTEPYTYILKAYEVGGTYAVSINREFRERLRRR